MRTLIASALALGIVAGCGGENGSDAIAPYWIENGIAVADLNGDGLADVIVARTYIAGSPPHPGSVTVYQQTPSHTFPAAATYAVGTDPWDLAVGDVNGDGAPDVVVANTTSGTISVLLHEADVPGSFAPARSLPVGGTPYSIAIRDLDGDGCADLAVALQNSGGGIVVLLQEHEGELSFQTPLFLSKGSGATSVAAGDLNQDGHPDIAVTGDDLTVFFQDSAHAFGPAVSFATGLRPSAVVIADVDEDGRNDLLVANAGRVSDGGGATVSVRFQAPSEAGRFLAAVNYPVAPGARHLFVAPLLSRSAPDIALISLIYSSQQPSMVSILQNQGSGDFAVRQVLTGPVSGNFLAAGDLNADGLPDLIANDGPEVFFQSAVVGTFELGAPLSGTPAIRMRPLRESRIPPPERAGRVGRTGCW